jgi:hypothetical protein
MSEDENASAPNPNQQHAESSRQGHARRAQGRSLAAEQRRLDQLNQVRSQGIYQFFPQAARRQYSDRLRRREEEFNIRYDQYHQRQVRHEALAQGPFAPGEVHEYVHESPWEGPAENQRLTDVTYSEWTQAGARASGEAKGKEKEREEKKGKEKKRDKDKDKGKGKEKEKKKKKDSKRH